MGEPFLGSEALATGRLTRHRLRTTATPIYPDVYVLGSEPLTAKARARAAWVWSRRRAVVAGSSAAALHGAKWIGGKQPAELLYYRRCPPGGIVTWQDRVADDEVMLIDGVRVTTPSRTAVDIACRYPFARAVAVLDALARATRLDVREVEALLERYPGRRGIRRARKALAAMNRGAESPRETWLRLLLARHGFPPVETQITVRGVYGEVVAVLDMGWKQLKVAIEYDGDHHRTDTYQFNRDIRRMEELTALGWIVIRVTSEDGEGSIVSRVHRALARRASTGGGLTA
ncbi:DUF559 domain-containing protein [Mycobacterium sp. MYCO198283]|uniref:DUF559 domain-containing protein n=1 Tax=Mycobacterium sp. MYCO198283 TaxID=2883505 RepID=UPI001E2AC984|nr:DUF559 domain-containing protein [Mycobacterium sp. MYCO198283]MCG5431357.1 DUF559 domain-containing protein [Mycobacterium sp. MYCO198283]